MKNRLATFSFLVRWAVAAWLAPFALLAMHAAQAQSPATPLIQWLVATPSSIASGGNTTLRWHVDGADSLSIDQGIGTVQAQGSLAISPATTTTYTLTATNANGTAQKSHVVVVAPNASASGGRFVKMVSPTGGQRFTAPATIRVFAAAFDPNGQNCGVGGFADRCASRVDFYVDNTLMAQVPAAQSEYWVFKSAFSGVAAGTHRVWARAIYTNPAASLDSEPMWVTVEAPPAYAQTVELTQDVVLTGSQNYEFIGTPTGRIRLNGNGHRITSSGNWTGRLTLKYVDLFDLGVMNDPTPAIDIGTSNAVALEDSIFDTTGTVSLFLTGTATASIRRNEFRSNMRMPEQQQPEFGPDSSYPAIALAGNSTAQKFFQGNTIGVGWADFRNADNWLIGSSAGGNGADGNIVIAPRGGIWAQNMTRTAIRGNFIYHVYFGGWSQGNVMEIGSSSDIVIEHNVVGGGSWPIRSLGGTLRYNLVIDAGHQWLWVTGDNASVHHNIFAGGDAEVAGIFVIGGPQNVDIYNNTIDGLGVQGVVPVWILENGAAALRANAIVNTPNPNAVRIDGTLDADYNLFSGQQGTARNYADNRAPTHDVGGLNAQVNPQFLEPSEPWRYAWEDIWTRRVSVNQVLANYRVRYTPAPGSPLIDTGETVLVAGSDIGAVGSGTPAIDDRFGLANTALPADTTPPTGSIQINAGAASTDQAAVTLTLSATDDASGVVEMRFSNDGISFAAPVAFAGTAAWTLTSGNGVKTVHAQFRDGAGNWSNAFTDTITLNVAAPVDTTPPTGTIQINGGAATTTQTAVTLNLTATDNASGVVEMRFSNDGTTFSAPIAFASTAAWVLTSGNGTKTVHAQFRDGAGNWSTGFIDTIVLSTAAPPSSLVAAYGFNEGQGSTVADASGNGLSGTVSNAAWVAGKNGNALQFTGQSNSLVSVANSALLQLTTAYTLEAWVNPQGSQTSEPTVIAKTISGDLPYVLYTQGTGGVGPNAYALVNGNYQQAAAPNFIPANTWTHIAATYNGATLSVYVNGVLAGSSAVSGSMATGNGALQIGNNTVFSSEGFVGRIDDVRVYNRALSATEIQTDMATPVGTVTPPPDTTPPTGTIVVNGGAASTDTTAVTLTLSATDNATGVVEMRFSNDGTTFSTPIAFATTAAWTLTSGAGLKTVQAQFRDGAGNWSNAVSDTITLTVAPPPDTTPPTGSVVIDGGAASTTQTTVTLTLAATDNATGVVEMRFSNDGITFGTPVAFAATASWALTPGNGTKTVHAQFRDGAGNWSAAFTDSIELAAGPVSASQLGAHVLLAQNEFAGTTPAVTPGINTQQSGSTLLALSMGWLRNLSAPVDTFGNQWTQLSGPNIYFSPDFYTAVWAVPNAIGGNNHKLSFNKTEYPEGEISMALIEVKNGGQVNMVYDLAPGSNQSPGSITVDGPATLIAIWGGDAFALDNTAVPDNGFTVIDSYLDFGTGDETAVQVAIATKQITAPGTYTVRWTSTPVQNCACYLIAVKNSQQAPVPTGLVAAYGFNEGQGTSAGDLSGNGLAGTVSNAAWVAGKSGNALQFTGQSNSLVSVANSPLLQLTAGYTLSAWVNPQAGQPSEPTVIAKTITGDLPYVLYTQGTGGVGPNAYALAGGNYQQAATPSLIPANTWTHVAATYNGSTLSVYVNGVLTGSTSVTGSVASGAGALQIGNNTVFSDEGFIGRIDDVRIYNRAQSAAEIQTDMATPLGGATEPPPNGEDTTPPTGTIVINGGAVSTEQTTVTLSLTATDNATGVVEMRFSNDGTNFSTPIPFATTATWVLTAGDGSKTVRAQFRDGAGNWSASVADSISFSIPQPLPPISTAHPRVLLVGAELQRMQNDLATQRPAMKRFKEQMVDEQLAGADIYGYEAWYSALMGVVSGQPQYCAHAVQMTDAFLDDEAARIQAGDTPVAREDSYLFIGEVIGNLSMVYDWCYGNLTATQKLRWGNYADRFVDNVWNQDTHHWGVPTAANGYSWDGTPKEPGSSWSVNNPVNNYYYSFLQATMLWGLVSKHEPGRVMADSFLQKFRHEKIQNQLVPIFEAQLTGGGSREGTGYGTAMGNLFLNYHLWEKSTGERIADLTSHTQSTMPYLMHAISPKRDFLAPIGDHARDSTAAFYDYHRKELASLAALHSGTPMARTVRDFLAGSTVPQMGDRFNWVYDVLYDGVETAAPAQLNTAYFAPGTGHFFSRSSWNSNATWLTFLTGAYTESHAHADGLSILLFKNGWLVNDANQSAHSGLANSQEAHGLVTQRLPGGALIDMFGLEADPGASPPRPESSARLKALAINPLYHYASSDQGTLFNHPNTGNPGVRQEREVVHIKPDIVVTFDRIDYAPGSTEKTYQLPIPGLPVITGRTATYSNGTSTLTVLAMQPAASTLAVTAMPTIDSDFEGGYRLDSRITTSGLTHFLNVLSVDGAVTTATQGANAGTVILTLSDGRVVTLAFNLNGQGGTIEIRNSANQVLVSEALASTVTVPAVTVN